LKKYSDWSILSYKRRRGALKISRTPRIKITRNGVPGEYIWSGATWFFASERPPLNIKPRGLWEMGRSCKIVTELDKEDLVRILTAFGLSRKWWEDQEYHLDQVKMTSPERLEYFAEQASRAA